MRRFLPLVLVILGTRSAVAQPADGLCYTTDRATGAQYVFPCTRAPKSVGPPGFGFRSGDRTTPLAVIGASGRVETDGDLSNFFRTLQVEGCRERGKGRCAVRILPGTYVISEPITLCSFPFDVEAYGATIRARNTTGIRVLHNPTCQRYGLPFAGGAGSGGGSIWRGGELVGVDVQAVKPPYPVGIQVETVVHLRDIRIESFVRGLQLLCNDVRQPYELVDGFEMHRGGRCNLGTFEGLTISSNQLDGIFVRGANANANTFVGINSFVNCRNARAIVGRPNYNNPERGGRCANYHDASFLGNTYVGTHSAFAIDTTSKPNLRYFQYLSTGRNQSNVWINPYAENGAMDGKTGNGPSWFRGANDVVIGGFVAFYGLSRGASRYGGSGRASRLHLESRQGAAGGFEEGMSMRVLLGQVDNTPSAFAITPIGTKKPVGTLRFRARRSGWVELEASPAFQDSMGLLYLGPSTPNGVRRGDFDATGMYTYLPPCRAEAVTSTISNETGLAAQRINGRLALCDLRR